MLDTTIFIIGWAILTGLFLRAYFTGRVSGYTGYSGWTQFFLCLFIFSVRDLPREQAIDALVDDFPLTLNAKSGAFVLWFALYTRFLKRVEYPSRRYGFTRAWLTLSAMILFIGGGLYATVPPEERAAPRDVLIAVRDALLLVPMLIMLIPGTRHLIDREHNRAARNRLAVVQIGYSILYPVIALANIGVGVEVITGINPTAWLQPLMPLILYGGVFLMLYILLPYRQTQAAYFNRLRVYWRLRRLHDRVYALSGAPDNVWMQMNPPLYTLCLPDRLEFALYMTTIYTLDYIRLLGENPAHADLHARFQTLIDRHYDLDALAGALVQVNA